MKEIKISAVFVSFLLIFFALNAVANAQLREMESKSSDYTGPVVKENAGNLSNLFNMQMDHSYSMTFSSIAGQYQNVNAYTNTMHFFFTDDLTGRVDLSLLHSPLGGNNYMNNNGLGTEIIIRNAELNYQISDKSNISLHFQQIPSYGINPWSRSPFNDSFHSGSTFRNY